MIGSIEPSVERSVLFDPAIKLEKPTTLRFRSLGSPSWPIDQNAIDLGTLLRFGDIIKASHFML